MLCSDLLQTTYTRMKVNWEVLSLTENGIPFYKLNFFLEDLNKLEKSIWQVYWTEMIIWNGMCISWLEVFLFLVSIWGMTINWIWWWGWRSREWEVLSLLLLISGRLWPGMVVSTWVKLIHLKIIRNTWSHIIVYKLFVSRTVTWNHICLQMIFWSCN